MYSSYSSNIITSRTFTYVNKDIVVSFVVLLVSLFLFIEIVESIRVCSLRTYINMDIYTSRTVYMKSLCIVNIFHKYTLHE